MGLASSDVPLAKGGCLSNTLIQTVGLNPKYFPRGDKLEIQRLTSHKIIIQLIHLHKTAPQRMRWSHVFLTGEMYWYSVASYPRSPIYSKFYSRAVGMINVLCRWVVVFLFFMF